VDFDTTGQQTTDNIFYIRQIREEKWEYNDRVRQLYIYFKQAYDSVRRKLFYNIFTESGNQMKLLRIIKMCLNKTYRQTGRQTFV
jgi:hypothetical protein